MKILHVLSQTELTGSEIYAQKVVDFLCGKGHEVLVISDTFHVPFAAAAIRATMPFNTRSRILKLKNLWQLRRLLHLQKFDVVHCHSRLAAKNIFRAGWGLHLPVVTTLHGIQHASYSKRVLNSYGDIVISVCHNLTKDLLEKTNLRPSQIIELPNPVSASPVPPWPLAEKERRVVIFAGRNSGPKGETFRELLHSQMEWWVKKFPQAEFRIFLHGLGAGTFFGEYMRAFPGVQVDGAQIDLAAEFRKHPRTIVFASGRTAVEAALAGAQVVGLGEAGYVGPLIAETLAESLASNFGDMGDVSSVDHLRITTDLDRLMKTTSDEGAETRAALVDHFQPARIFLEIEDIYFSARLKKKCAGVPILMYHRIPDEPLRTRHRTFVTKKNFQKHLATFRFFGRETLTFAELADFWFGRRSLSDFPRRPLILTFDDGYRDLLTNAEAVLRERRMRATVFLLSRTDYDVNSWDDPTDGELSSLLNAEERARLDLKVFEIGSHGDAHLDYTTLADSEIHVQMQHSRAKLKKEFPDQEILTFAFPFGRRNDHFSELARAAGYTFAVNTDEGAEDFYRDRFSLYRVNTFPEENFFSLWKKSRPDYLRRAYLKRKRATSEK